MASHDEHAAAAAPLTLYTIGHGNRSAHELVALLQEAGVRTLADVRAVPRSRRNPQFDSETLRETLEPTDITYHWAGRQLGGRRPARNGSPHLALADEGLRAYADYMDGREFERAAAQLMNLVRRAPTAILCAERDPMNCHRSLIADYLVLAGVRVIHLIDTGDSREHQLRPEARRESARLVYDRNTTADLGF
jgi:uncharacterized protein (DUF488 family)